MAGEDHDLITIIVQQKHEEKTLVAALKAGAPGETYFYGRGTGVRQRLGFIGSLIEKEKVVILTVVPTSKTDGVVAAVSKVAELDKPGNGFLCVQRVNRVIGLL
jgi:nitrogen regulatory protein PII